MIAAPIILEAWRLIHGIPEISEDRGGSRGLWNASRGSIRVEPTKVALERIVAKESKSWGEPLYSNIPRWGTKAPISWPRYVHSGARDETPVRERKKRSKFTGLPFPETR